MVAEATPIHELSKRESELLAAFLILRFDYIALAERYKLLPEQLLAFAQSPAIASRLALLKTFAEASFTLRSLESRTIALDTLEKVAKHSDDPIEQRRAASTILRGTGLQRDRRPPSSPTEGGGGGGPAGGVRAGGGSIPASSTHAPNLQSEPLPTNTHNDTIPAPAPLLSHSTHTETNNPITISPGPDIPPPLVAACVAEVLRAPDDYDNLLSLHPFFAQGATLASHPVPEDIDAFAASAAQTLSTNEPVTHCQVDPGPSTETSAFFSITRSNTRGLETTFTLHLARLSNAPHPNSWLIFNLSQNLDTS